MIANFFFNFNIFSNRISFLNYLIINKLLVRLNIIAPFYRLNDLIWQEGLLIDFLQKKITDN
jgi:hypothetical protein